MPAVPLSPVLGLPFPISCPSRGSSVAARGMESQHVEGDAGVEDDTAGASPEGEAEEESQWVDPFPDVCIEEMEGMWEQCR